VPLPPAVREFLEDCAAGRYFEAHERLEGLWWERDSDPFLQGLILLAAAHVKLQRGSPAGARKHFLAAAAYLEPFAPAHRGFDVAAAIAQARAAVAALAAHPGRAAVPPLSFRLLPGAAEAWADLPAQLAAPELAEAVRTALAERRASGQPVGTASWGALVKEVTRRTGGRAPRAAVRAAVRAALGGG